MKLRDYLNQNGIRQVDFAAKVQTTAATICRVCNGQVPRRKLLLKIVEATDGQVLPNDLCGISKDNTKA